MNDEKHEGIAIGTQEADERSVALEELIDSLETTDDYPPIEDAVDSEIDDSFPASDAPSSTPTTSLGGPEHGTDET